MKDNKNNFWDEFDNFLNWPNFSSSTGKTYDWEELKKQGKVNEIIEEKDGIKTITKTFTSDDGNYSIVSTSSEFVANTNKQSIDELNIKIQKAIADEDYEQAHELNKIKKSILNKK